MTTENFLSLFQKNWGSQHTRWSSDKVLIENDTGIVLSSHQVLFESFYPSYFGDTSKILFSARRSTCNTTVQRTEVSLNIMKLFFGVNQNLEHGKIDLHFIWLKNLCVIVCWVFQSNNRSNGGWRERGDSFDHGMHCQRSGRKNCQIGTYFHPLQINDCGLHFGYIEPVEDSCQCHSCFVLSDHNCCVLHSLTRFTNGVRTRGGLRCFVGNLNWNIFRKVVKTFWITITVALVAISSKMLRISPVRRILSSVSTRAILEVYIFLFSTIEDKYLPSYDGMDESRNGSRTSKLRT